jgi:hypothetical protein
MRIRKKNKVHLRKAILKGRLNFGDIEVEHKIT